MKRLAIFLTIAMVAGCAGDTLRESQALIENGNEEQGLERLERAVREHPNYVELRNYYLRHRAVAVQRYLQTGDNARAAGAIDAAEVAYQRAQRFDPDNANAQAGLEAVARERASQGLVREAEEAFKRGAADEAYEKAKQALAVNPTQRSARAIVRKVEEQRVKAEGVSPQLTAALKNTVTIELRDAPVRSVLELISKRSGLNFVYDRDVSPDLRVTVSVRDTTIEEVLRFVLVTSQLERRVLNSNTVLVYPNTPVKAQAYRELTVKSFYLANADVKATANMVRSLAKTRDLYVDEKLNLLIVRDTPEAVRMVEKLIAAQDLGEPEVMLEVEVLEVGQNTLSQIGIQWPSSGSLSVIGAAGVPGQITGTEAQNLSSGNFRITVSDPLLALNLREQAGRSNLLANPRIRVKNKEKARIHIGDKVPVITTTAGATGFVSESVNYLDVGLKLEVEPLVSLEDEVGIKVGLEVSNISQEVKTTGGTVAYQVGTRNAATTLRLRDGETQVLAGLISDEDRRTASKVPGVSRLPVVGRLFSNNGETVNKTEVVLLITPRVIRNIERPGARIEEFNSGTELEVGRGGVGAAVSIPPVIAPATAPKPPGAPEGPRPPAAGPAPKPQQSPQQ
ncbi:MAG TPA: secretin and TonB N-terminal domain-containing protein [Burkholderiales bacterium]|nr:secretin and TonB N-terminal domain-containing protein [Burkholderiales bacterium]